MHPGILINVMFQVLDVIVSNTNDVGPLSLESFRKNNLSASWRVAGLRTSNAMNQVWKTDVLLLGAFISCLK